MSYADILRRVEAGPNLEDLLKLRRSKESKAEGFYSQVKNLIGASAAVRAQKDEIQYNIQYKDLVDRSDQRRRCGETGYNTPNYNKEPRCMWCYEKRGLDSRHIAGRDKCPEFEKLLTAVIK